MSQDQMSWSVLGAIVLLVLIAVGGGLVGCPYYKVWERKMAGQAELQLMGALMASNPPFSSTMTPAARASMEKAIRWHQRQAGLHHGALMEFLL